MRDDIATGNNKPFSLIIVGPTASGKTSLSYAIAELISCEIINADMGQFYTPLTIGTAKPDWQNSPFPSHLFDILSDPQDLSSYRFCGMVFEAIQQITTAGNLPIIVGGSLFYVKSLFFPQKSLDNRTKQLYEVPVQPGTVNNAQELWDLLHSIDPERAAKLHVNDVYRVKRALEIWKQTGKKPSQYAPEFAPTCNTIIIVLCPPKEVLKQRIMDRTVQMIEQEGWIDEARRLVNTPWEPFLKAKGLIGYSEIFEWVHAGENKDSIPDLIKKIQFDTLHYAKRQITFLNSFIAQLERHQGQCNEIYATKMVTQSDAIAAHDIVNFLHNRGIGIGKKSDMR